MTAIDTNVFVSLWDENKVVYLKAREALDSVLAEGQLVVAAPVYAELLARPYRTQRMLNQFFSEAAVQVDWNISEQVWRMAGEASQAHGVRRRASRGGEPRRIIADFVIGAHALMNGYSLLTLDRAFFVRNFPGLIVKSFL
jgi:predicted nucleic acid-binding protein